MLTKELFLFFITTSGAQCYYVTDESIVDTCQPGDPRSWVPNAPGGWLEQQIGYGRNMTTWASNRHYTEPLKFTGDGARIVRHAMYVLRGTQERLFLNINKYNPETDVYDPYYKGELDMMNNVDDDHVTSISLNVIEGGLLKMLKAYEKTLYEIPVDGSIPENKLININGLLFNGTYDYTIMPTGIDANGTVLPMTFLNKMGSDVNAISADQAKLSFDPFDNTVFTQLIGLSPNFHYATDRALANVNFKTQIRFTGSRTAGCLVIWTSLNNFYPCVNTCNAGRVASGAIVNNQLYNVNVTIPTLAVGENCFLMFLTTDEVSPVAVQTAAWDINFNSQFQDTTTYGLAPYDLLNLLLRAACQDAFIFPEQKVYKLQSALLQQHSNLVLTSGSALRKENGAVIKTSIAEFFTAFDAELSAAQGNLITTDAPGEVMFFERLATVLDSSVVTMDLGEVAKMHTKPATDMYFDIGKFGYPEQKYDEKQGNQEWNTTGQWRAPISNLNKQFTKISPYRADPYGIEYTRVLINTSNSANNKSDNDTFILNVDYSNTVAAQAYANGTQGTYYGSGYIFTGDLQGTNLGPLMRFNNITGSGISAAFSLVQQNTVNDTLRYNGGNLPVSMILKCQFQFRGDLSIHYYSTRNIFGTVRKYKEPLINFSSGPFKAVFNMKYNGLVIYSQQLVLVGGQVNSFTVSVPLNNFPLKFADKFQMEIVYNTADVTRNPPGAGTDEDGFLLVFNINDMVITASDNTAPPVYGLTKKAYTSSNLANAQFAYNIEELTPFRLLNKHAGYIKSIFYNQLDKKFTFQTSDKNRTLSTTIDGVTITEGQDVPIGTLDGEPLFYPFYFEFETRVPVTFMQLMAQSANGHIRFTYCGFEFFGFPMDVKVKPALEDAQEWRLLCSPRVNLAQLENIEQNGINNIDLMEYGTAFSKLSPVPFYPLGYVQPAIYNFIHMNMDWWINQVGFWPFKENYFQKWQTNDVVKLQCVTNGLAPVHCSVIKKRGDDSTVEIASFDFTQKVSPAVKAPLILWEAAFALAGVPDDTLLYYVVTSGTGGTTTVFISEGQHIRTRWPMTMLGQYRSRTNRQATVFTTGYDPGFRVEAWIDEQDTKSAQAQFTDQRQNVHQLNAIPYEVGMLNVGTEGGVPPWVKRLVTRMMLLDAVTWDGVGFTHDGEPSWEKIDVPGWPKKYWKTAIREAEVTDVITLNTAGDLDDNLTVIYNIDTAAFGDGAGNANIVQVTKVSGS